MQTAQTAIDWIGMLDVIAKLALIPILAAALVLAAKHLGIKLSAQQEIDLQRSLERGLLLAEEQGTKWLKDHGQKIPGHEKLAIAVQEAREASKTGLSQFPTDPPVEKLIEAELVRFRPLLSSPPPPSYSLSPPRAPSMVPLTPHEVLPREV